MVRIRRCWALGAVALVVLAMAAVGCGGSDDDESSEGGSGKLVIGSFGGTWGEALELGLAEPFERETGIDVVVNPTVDLAASRAAIESGNNPPEDITDWAWATHNELEKDGLLAKIDYDEFDEATTKQVPEELLGESIVGWAQVGTGLCFDKTEFPDGERQPSTWADFWDTQTFPGKRAMLAWSIEPEPEFGLVAAGEAGSDPKPDPGQLYPLDVDLAFEQVEKLRPSIAAFPESPSVIVQLLIDGEVAMAPCFTHRAWSLIDSGFEDRIGVSFDQARSVTQTWAVWKDAPNRENAMKFIAWAFKPENQARWAQLANAAPSNPAALKEMPEEARERAVTSPTHETTFHKDDSYYIGETEGKTNHELITERWLEFAGSGG
jgi:putative spermidine/putrescine transport system substrate-binding protein